MENRFTKHPSYGIPWNKIPGNNYSEVDLLNPSEFLKNEMKKAKEEYARRYCVFLSDGKPTSCDISRLVRSFEKEWGQKPEKIVCSLESFVSIIRSLETVPDGSSVSQYTKLECSGVQVINNDKLPNGRLQAEGFEYGYD